MSAKMRHVVHEGNGPSDTNCATSTSSPNHTTIVPTQSLDSWRCKLPIRKPNLTPNPFTSTSSTYTHVHQTTTLCISPNLVNIGTKSPAVCGNLVQEDNEQVESSVNDEYGDVNDEFGEDYSDKFDEDYIENDIDPDIGDENGEDIFGERLTEEILDKVNTSLRIESVENVEMEFSDLEEEEVHMQPDQHLPSDEEELNSGGKSDEEQDHYVVFTPEVDFKRKINLTLGQKFPTNKVFRKALQHHSIENGYDYYLLHNNNERITVFCKSRCNCKWVKGEGKLPKCNCQAKRKCCFKVHARKVRMEATFQIKSLKLGHTCGCTYINSKVTSEFLAEKFLEDFKDDPTMRVSTLKRKIMRKLGVSVGYYEAYYAKIKAMKMIYGNADHQYMRVWDYAATLKKYNPGSSVFIALGSIERPPLVFQRMYVCMEACKHGFIRGCRPILGVDGCHLSVLSHVIANVAII